MNKIPKLPTLTEEQRTPLVAQLLEVIHYQMEVIQTMRDEIAILKGNKPKPDIKPGKMENKSNTIMNKKSSNGKRPGSEKKSKTDEIVVHDTIIIKAENVPDGSTQKGYKDYVVQGIVIKSYNRLYRLERWETPDGTYVSGKLPEQIQGHFDPTLISFILYQYYQCHVTQPLLREELKEFNIKISTGQINNILINGHDKFNNEKNDILKTGLEISSYINTDDTGARHAGQNGYCTHIGNDLFAWFESTVSKSRINFLRLLRHGDEKFYINEEVLYYMKMQLLPLQVLKLLANHNKKLFLNDKEWNNHLVELGIINMRHIRIATEGAIVGTLFKNGFNKELVILSDDAGQFNVFLFLHALCWIHAERLISKVIPFTNAQRQSVNAVREKIWLLYTALKHYKTKPSLNQKILLKNSFDEIFKKETCFITLNNALTRIFKNKDELLLVLERPEIPIHNNASENDIREYVKRRKISGGTRSDIGRKCRDTFTSLKKTSRKLGVSFWEYLNDRISKGTSIPQLSKIMRQRASPSTY